MELKDRIKKLRKDCGLSQEKVAEYMGVSRQAVTKWENGQSAPSTENLLKLAALFGTTVDMLMSDKDKDHDLVQQVFQLCLKEKEKKEKLFGEQNEKKRTDSTCSDGRISDCLFCRSFFYGRTGIG